MQKVIKEWVNNGSLYLKIQLTDNRILIIGSSMMSRNRLIQEANISISRV